jgi:hypothetical protein
MRQRLCGKILGATLLSLAATGLIVGGATASGALRPRAEIGQVAGSHSVLPSGSQHVTFHWEHQSTRASFSGTIGHESFTGTSAASSPFTGAFVVKAKFGAQSFSATLGLAGEIKGGVEFRITGKLGTTLVSGTGKLTSNIATLTTSLAIAAKVGSQTVTGSLSYKDSQDTVQGTLKIS